MRVSHVIIAAIFTTTIAVTPALAVPSIGSPAPKASAESLGGKDFNANELRGKTTVIFYENKDVTTQNRALKAALQNQKKKEGYGEDVQVIAVADVSAWNFWPAKGFVQDAIRKEEKKAGHPIYLDWTGTFGEAFKMNRNASNVVLVGPDSKVKVSHAGPVPAGKALDILMATGK
jgi:predicted transcriptional regulator